MSLRVVIADDEAGIRLVLRKALEKIGNVIVVGEATNGLEAIALIEQNQVDAIFMDVEMPLCDGVQASKQILDIEPKMMIVFITAFQEYMPDAFSLYVFDYMVKPFKFDRLKETVERMLSDVEKNHSTEPEKKIVLKTKQGVFFSNPESIILIQRTKRITEIITKKEHFEVTEALFELEELLPQDLFIRSHKSYLINFRDIKDLVPYGRWTHLVRFHSIKEDALMNSEKYKIVKNILKF